MGSGHALESFGRLKNNISLKKQRSLKYSNMKKAVSKIHSKYHKFEDRSTLSEDQREFLKKEIRIEIQKDKQKTFITSVFVTIVIVSIIYLVGQFLFDYFLN